MRMIYKYNLEVRNGPQRIRLPEGSKILHVDNQFEQIALWIEVDLNNVSVDRLFFVLGTGDNISADLDAYYGKDVHIGTVILMGGTFVWHVYEKVDE